MSILDAHAPRIDDLDAIVQMQHVRSFQLTSHRVDQKVAVGWRAIVNDRRYEASMEPGDTIASLVARARAQLSALADGDVEGLQETTGKQTRH